MKAALVKNGIVQNIIVWDETCVCPNGFDIFVFEDDHSISIGWEYDGVAFASSSSDPISVEPPQVTFSDLKAQLDAITAQLSALEIK